MRLSEPIWPLVPSHSPLHPIPTLLFCLPRICFPMLRPPIRRQRQSCTGAQTEIFVLKGKKPFTEHLQFMLQSSVYCILLKKTQKQHDLYATVQFLSAIYKHTGSEMGWEDSCTGGNGLETSYHSSGFFPSLSFCITQCIL